MPRPVPILLTAACSGVMLVAFLRPVQAQSARPSSGNSQAMQQLQQLAAERTRLEADNAKLKAELDAVRKERDALASKQDNAARSLRASDAAATRAGARAQSLEIELTREKERTAEIIAKFRETVGTLREVETDRTSVRTSLAARDVELKECIARNLALYTLNGEVLTRLEKPRGFTPASALEPFTKLKRVEFENLIDGYQQRAEEQKPPVSSLAKD